jgi:hypothetical protein
VAPRKFATRGFRLSRVFLGGLVALITVCAPAAPAPAATTITLTSNGNSGGGTLRAALLSASPGDTILIPGSFTIVLASPLTVTQAAPGVTIGVSGTGTPTISGNNATRILQTNGNTALAINRLVLTAGEAKSDGGAISVGAGATVNISDSVLSGNGSSAAFGDGAAIQVGPSGILTIQRSTFANNHGGSSSGNGGAIQASSKSIVTVGASTFSGNHAGAKTGSGGAIQMDGTTLTVTNSTFSGNSAGAESNGGGAIQTSSSPATTLLNDTISGNQAFEGGGIYVEGGGATVTNTIISGNTATAGANCAATGGPAIAGGGHNLENGTSCGFTGTGNLNTDPAFAGPLADNGGPTATLALLSGSPAIDNGDAGACPPTDQRGLPRPGSGGTTCDIGAFEFQLPPPLPPSNKFSIGKLNNNRRKGTAKSPIFVPGPGLIQARDARGLPASSRVERPAKKKYRPLIKPANVIAAAAGKVLLPLIPSAAGRKILKAKGRFRVKVRVTFTPTGGTPASQTFSPVLKLNLKKRH